MLLDLCSESKECCTYPKGNNFEYVRFIQEGKRYFLEGKGRYGCVIKQELSEKQAEAWVRIYQQENRII